MFLMEAESTTIQLSAVFAKSQRGNPVIMIGQYRFNRVNKHGVRTRWVCVKAKAGCRASLHTIDNAIVRVWGMHDPLAHTTPNRV
ncbi:FLYWCH zinc finger domain-containing protein [Phthorimaea operculella]|nr:FLYWCH zinc finger domain-containing protein [Phthorimaea operculella]